MGEPGKYFKKPSTTCPLTAWHQVQQTQKGVMSLIWVDFHEKKREREIREKLQKGNVYGRSNVETSCKWISDLMGRKSRPGCSGARTLTTWPPPLWPLLIRHHTWLTGTQASTTWCVNSAEPVQFSLWDFPWVSTRDSSWERWERERSLLRKGQRHVHTEQFSTA